MLTPLCITENLCGIKLFDQLLLLFNTVKDFVSNWKCSAKKLILDKEVAHLSSFQKQSSGGVL